MSDSEWDDNSGDDEDWYDDGDDDDDAVECPECGGLISSTSDKCAACGYWLSAADHRRLRSESAKPWWVTVTVVILLLVFLTTMLSWL